MKKLILIMVVMFGTILLAGNVEARGWGGCGNDCGPSIEDVRIDLGLDPETGLAPNTDTKKGSSASEKARIMAEIEEKVKDFKDSGIKDLDEIHDWDLGGKSEAERDAGKCFKKTWYGKKEITCPK